MAEARITRRLAAILAADVVGYSRMMAGDEAGTLAALKRHREVVFDPIVAQYSGRIVKLIGDGTLVEFASVVDAVNCALAIQRILANEATAGPNITLRIGVNLGDVIIDGDDIYGDGVNVAARLEPLAEPGGICVASIVNESVGNRIDVTFENSGEINVKNIDRPISIWRWHPKTVSGPVAASNLEQSPTKKDKPSIAVLPFTNMSDDQEQEYFSDGITEDIITDLSKVAGLLVIARNSSFAYKGKSIDVRTIGRELGVRSVLEGSVRRAGNRVRITAQLIDAADGGHLWAERYDRNLEDIFAVQDEVTRKIVAALHVKLTSVELARREDTAKVNPEAQDYYYRARALLYTFNPQSMLEARQALNRATAIDPGMAPAYATLALIIGTEFINGWNGCERDTLEQGLALSRKAIEVDPHSGDGYATLCISHLWRRELDAAIDAGRQSVALDPNLALGHGALGQALDFNGQHEEALAEFNAAFLLDPRHDLLLNVMGRAQFALGRYEEAEANFRRRLIHNPDTDVTRAYLAALCGETGRTEEARSLWRELLEISPRFDPMRFRATYPYQDSNWFDRFYGGLRKAGIIE
jgi:adenylate cyclase